MSKEICISSTPHETRLAIIEDDQLTEVYYERENEYTLAGSIYKGRVTRVLPGMQSAFVDVGLERDAFLYVTDFLEEQEDSADFEHLATGNGRQENRDSAGRDTKEPRVAITSDAPALPGDESGQRRSAAPTEQFEEGTRRWRGRRGRRGRNLRPQSERQPSNGGRTETPARAEAPLTIEPESHAHRDESQFREATPPQSDLPLYLPGESLSKYGGQAAKQIIADSRETPQAVVSTSKPSTLIETPIEWDGGNLLPGESISRYRDQAGEKSSGATLQEETAPAHLEEHPVQPEQESMKPEAAAEVPDANYNAGFQDSEFLAESASVSAEEQVQPYVPPTYEDLRGEAVEVHEQMPTSSALVDEEAATEEVIEPENASASYRIDPVAPSEFRVPSPASVLEEGPVTHSEEFPSVPEFERHFQQEHTSSETAPAGEDLPAPEQAEVNEFEDDETGEGLEELAPEIHVSGSAAGLVEEEEVAEEEEYDFTPLYAHTEEHDLEELEEETLEQQAMAGAEIDDMVRDVHLDQRINAEPAGLAVDELEDDSELDEESGEEELEGELPQGEPIAAAAGQPARPDRQDQRRGGGRGNRHDGRRRHNGRRQTAQTTELPIISELLKQGQEILVQIAKEPIAKKGARITSHIALPGRFLVFMPTVNHVGVSRKISSDEERQRLKRILISEKGAGGGGFIVRTAADGASEEDLRADIRFLISLWAEIKQRADAGKAPALIYHDLNLVERILRDQVSDNFSTIWVDNESEYERIVRFLNRFQPSLVRRVKLYTKETPLFEQFGIQDEISKALKSKVWLKSGGSIVINQTEALVAIDINTGKYVGKTARLEDTILKTNLDAIPEIVRQIRLRDLGGIIVIDFIDMDERKNRHKVMQALEEALKADRAPSKVLQFNDFGLVAITRKRVKQSLERTLCTQCSVCSGTGMVKSPTTVCNEIYVEMRKMQRSLERHDVLLRVHPDVVKALKATNARWLNELEEMSGKTIIVKSDPALHPEQFDIH